MPSSSRSQYRRSRSLPSTTPKPSLPRTASRNAPTSHQQYVSELIRNPVYLSNMVRTIALKNQLNIVKKSLEDSPPVSSSLRTASNVAGAVQNVNEIKYIGKLKLVQAIEGELDRIHKFCKSRQEILLQDVENLGSTLLQLTTPLHESKKSLRVIRDFIQLHTDHVTVIKELLPFLLPRGYSTQFPGFRVTNNDALNSPLPMHRTSTSSSVSSQPLKQEKKSKYLSLPIPMPRTLSSSSTSSASSSLSFSSASSSGRSVNMDLENVDAEVRFQRRHDKLTKRTVKLSKRVDDKDLKAKFVSVSWLCKDIFLLGQFMEKSLGELKAFIEEGKQVAEEDGSDEFKPLLTSYNGVESNCRELVNKLLSAMTDALSKLYPSIDDFLCPICFSVLFNATVLPCNHRFCRQCLKQYNSSLPSANTYFPSSNTNSSNESNPRELVYVSPFLPSSKTPPPVRKQPCPVCRRINWISNMKPPKTDNSLNEFVRLYFPKETKKKRRVEKSEAMKEGIQKRWSGMLKAVTETSLLGWGGQRRGSVAIGNWGVGL
ncbi:hypothetical protein BKA69DRAFT_1081286 [Paraphysoderma sedebokerense]|nr:hypothetical protein BKA69DRAFT_1081286 [Paraphysoderma sedebokerense]